MLRGILLSGLCLLSMSVSAQSLESSSEIKNGGLTIQLLNPQTEEPFPFYQYRKGSMVAGPSHQPYLIQVTNNQPLRIELLVGVENKDPRTGETARLGQAGYILNPGQTLRLKHGRKKQNFVFPAMNANYNHLTQAPALQLIIYQEVPNYPYVLPWAKPIPFTSIDVSTNKKDWSPYIPPLFRRNTAHYPDVLLIKIGSTEYLQQTGILPSNTTTAVGTQ